MSAVSTMLLLSFALCLACWIELTDCRSSAALTASSLFALPPQEYAALHELYQSTNGSQWRYPSTLSGHPWNFTDGSNPCSSSDPWYGVNCSTDCSSSPCSVRLLTLSFYYLQGKQHLYHLMRLSPPLYLPLLIIVHRTYSRGNQQSDAVDSVGLVLQLPLGQHPAVESVAETDYT